MNKSESTSNKEGRTIFINKIVIEKVKGTTTLNLETYFTSKNTILLV